MGNPDLIGSSEKFQAVLDDVSIALECECERLKLLVGELLLQNHQLRCEVTRLLDASFAEAIWKRAAA